MLLTIKIFSKCTALSFQKYPRNKTHDTQNSEPDNKKEQYLVVSMKDISLLALPYPSNAKCLQLKRHLDDCIIMIRNGVRRTRVRFFKLPCQIVKLHALILYRWSSKPHPTLIRNAFLEIFITKILVINISSGTHLNV